MSNELLDQAMCLMKEGGKKACSEADGYQIRDKIAEARHFSMLGKIAPSILMKAHRHKAAVSIIEVYIQLWSCFLVSSYWSYSTNLTLTFLCSLAYRL